MRGQKQFSFQIAISNTNIHAGRDSVYIGVIFQKRQKYIAHIFTHSHTVDIFFGRHRSSSNDNEKSLVSPHYTIIIFSLRGKFIGLLFFGAVWFMAFEMQFIFFRDIMTTMMIALAMWYDAAINTTMV